MFTGLPDEGGMMSRVIEGRKSFCVGRRERGVDVDIARGWLWFRLNLEG